MPRNLWTFFDCAARRGKPFQSMISWARARWAANSPESYTLPVGAVEGIALGRVKFFRRSGCDAGLGRGHIAQPLDQIGRLRSPGAAIGIHRQRVGEGSGDVNEAS